MKIVIPILIVPGGEASLDDMDAVTATCKLLQDFWETRNVPGLLLYHHRPASPPCAYGKDFFFPTDWYPGSPDDAPWTATKKFLLEQYPPDNVMASLGITSPDDLIYLVFLKDFDNPMEAHSERQFQWWGWSSIGTVGVDRPLRWAVLDYDLIYDLPTASLDALDTQGNHAMGAICHEEGHSLGWFHTSEPYPNLMMDWSSWPAVNIPQVAPK